MKLKLQDLTQEEMLNIDGGKGKGKTKGNKKFPWQDAIEYGWEAAKWVGKNAGGAGKIDSRYKHGAPGRKF
ncbi:hypothetical protein QUG28_28730 [Bacillus hominis]|uniref:hypothetical protein n=1 Tax=Bacillus hominis TaxID=2817478 RepID=UPI0025A0656B|nr:hypothetical protein [Bacillus hominis]MDM5436620.1 hypothetical protein [Bacillus hominis]